MERFDESCTLNSAALKWPSGIGVVSMNRAVLVFESSCTELTVGFAPLAESRFVSTRFDAVSDATGSLKVYQIDGWATWFWKPDAVIVGGVPSVTPPTTLATAVLRTSKS